MHRSSPLTTTTSILLKLPIIMATADVQAVDSLPSHMRPVPGSVNIPIAKYPKTNKPGATFDPSKSASDFVESFNQALGKQDFVALSQLFVEDGYWRDHLALSWHFRTVQSQASILDFLKSTAGSKDGFRLEKIFIDISTELKAPKVAAIDHEGNVLGVQFFIALDTKIGKGVGVARLVEQDGKWKIFTLYTKLDELLGYEEVTGERRPKGVQHGGKPGRKNWAEQRQSESEFKTSDDPAVLVVGKCIPASTRPV